MYADASPAAPNSLRIILISLLISTGLAGARAAAPAAGHNDRRIFTDSIQAVPPTPTDATGRPNRDYISRMQLRSDELAAPARIEVALQMRNFAELEARLAHSEIISPEEMQARYLPLAADHERVIRWLESEGMAVTRTDHNRLAVFASASVSEVGRIFQTRFARIASAGQEFTSAIDAPHLPAELAPAIRGIHGLQPHQRLHRRPHAALQPLAGTGSSLPYYPAQIAHAYNADNLGLTGAGQTIAIYALGFPSASDLASFWSTTGASASAANIQNVRVAGGPGTSTSSGNIEEATLDVEWASALAPGAAIRIYAADENDPVGDDELIQQVLADLPTQPTLHQLTISFGLDENAADRDYIAIEAQYMATLVSAGVTVFAASGDNGSLDNELRTIQTGFPASMPDVTAVGGTTLNLDSSGNVATETAWGSLGDRGTSGASGGGVSVIFNRPAWQNVAGAPAGAMRLIPDVAAVGDPATAGLVIFKGAQHQIGGTSLSSPIWAAWCALMNQARATAGKAPLGALNPRLYPLAGTSAFRDVTAGGNSVFHAGPGYDLCTGIGVPNVAALIQGTLSDSFAPVIEVQSLDRFTTAGQSVTFYVVATSAPQPTFQWQRLAAGAVTWADLADDATYDGAKSYALQVGGATPAQTGDEFRCVITNALGSVVSQPEALTVATSGVSTLAGWPGWSGFADGKGSLGRFNYTGSVRVGSDGTVYVADASNNTIRKISPSGIVSTLAGAPGVAGSADGPGSAARFSGPAGVAVDPAGNLFIADSQNYTVRKISPAGVVSTFAGTAGTRGRTDGLGSAATFFDPENIAIDGAGNLYVADGQGNIVRKITPAGAVTTLAGAAQSGTTDGVGAAARFNLPAGIAVDAAGIVYVGDYNNNSVRKITPDGTVTTLAGLSGTRNFGFVDGTGTTARFDGPTGLAVAADGALYVGDSNNNAIRRISSSGFVTTVAGLPSVIENIDGPLSAARFYAPADVALDAAGNLYIADSLNCTVRRIVLGPPATVPFIAAAPPAQTIAAGSTLALAVSVTGNGPFLYQWNKDGSPISGATGPTFVLANATAAAAGRYSVTVASSAGSVVSTPAAIAVVTADPSRLTNLSVRTRAGTGAQTLTVGFVLTGAGGKPLVVRGIGPALAAFGVGGTLSDPLLTVFGPNSSTVVAATDDNWNTSDTAAMSAVGAFPLTAGSKDAALATTLSAGAYSAQIAGAGSATGIALAEIYDAAPATTAHLVNVSARAQVDTGAGILIAGFSISGSVSKTVLIRGVGPGLTPFGVTGVLTDPRLELYNSSNVLIQGNDDWSGSPALSTAFTQTGAFALPSAASKDAALLITLPPGSYTAQISGANSATGVALVEFYDVN